MKKVAICFWGQTRTFSVLEECYSKLKDDDIQFDFFVSTWDDFNNKEPFYDLCTDNEFIDDDGLEFKNHTDKASYLIHRVNTLKTKHELENNFIYDYVLWTRSEILFKPEDLIKLFKDKVQNHKDLELNLHNDLIRKDDDGYPYLSSDYFFLGTSLSFDLYSCGWKYYFKRNRDFEQGRHGGHNYHAYVIENLPFDISVMNIPHKFQFSKLTDREVS